MPLPKKIAEDLKEWNKHLPHIVKYKKYLNGQHSVAWVSEKFEKNGSWLTDISTINYCNSILKAYTDGLKIQDWTNESIPSKTKNSLARLESFVDDEAFGVGDSFIVAVKQEDRVQAYHQPAESIWPIVNVDEPDKLSYALRIGKKGSDWELQVIDEETITTYVSSTKTVRKHIPLKEDEWDAGVSEPHGFDYVPVFWFKHNPKSQFSHGRSILHDVINVQDQYNKFSADSLLGSEEIIQTIKYITGIDPDDLTPQYDERSGKFMPPKLTFDAVKDSILLSTATGQAGEFKGPNIEGIIKLKNMSKTELANVAGLPPYYWIDAPDNVAAETVAIYERRLRNARESYQMENTPVWEALVESLGFEATPLWKSLDEEIDTTVDSEEERTN